MLREEWWRQWIGQTQVLSLSRIPLWLPKQDIHIRCACYFPMTTEEVSVESSTYRFGCVALLWTKWRDSRLSGLSSAIIPPRSNLTKKNESCRQRLRPKAQVAHLFALNDRSPTSTEYIYIYIYYSSMVWFHDYFQSNSSLKGKQVGLSQTTIAPTATVLTIAGAAVRVLRTGSTGASTSDGVGSSRGRRSVIMTDARAVATACNITIATVLTFGVTLSTRAAIVGAVVAVLTGVTNSIVVANWLCGQIRSDDKEALFNSRDDNIATRKEGIDTPSSIEIGRITCGINVKKANLGEPCGGQVVNS